MNREEEIREFVKKKNYEEIRKNQQYGEVYKKILSQGVKNSQD